MSSLSLICPSTGGHEEAVTSWRDTMTKPWDVWVLTETTGDEAGFLTKCERGWRETDGEVVGFLHSDLYIQEKGWDGRVLNAFTDPEVAIVGFVGATGLADDLIYRVPYDFRQLARRDVYSNLSDWGVHGAHEAGSRKVAVLDSCAIFVRRALLVRIDGWPVYRYPNSSHCSDLWICCMARRFRMKVELVGVKCTHRSGGRGTVGEEWLSERGGDSQMHQAAHVLIYNDFRDVLPIRVR